MIARIAINGFGRIGRCVLRALYERPQLRNTFVIQSINEPADAATIAHLLKYDSTHGKFPLPVICENQTLVIDGDVIALTHHDNIDHCRWHDVDFVFECSGEIATAHEARVHLQNGARRVLFSQPADLDVDATIVFGVNHHEIAPEHRIVSAASCTTNAVVPVLQVLDRAFGVKSGTMTTLHSAMNDQPVIDAYHHTDLRKTRSAMHSMIPVETGLARGIARILPHFQGKLIAQAMRVPTMNVSAMDISLRLDKAVSADDVIAALGDAATHMPDILALCSEPLASCDYNHDSHSAIVDVHRVQVVDRNLVKLLIWFDNEWAYANRMLDIAASWLEVAAGND